MIEDILGNLNEQQQVLGDKLAQIEITKKSPHDEISVSTNANKEILDITINKNFEDLGELEDLLVITLNQALKESEKIAAEETNKLLNSMLPGDLPGLFG